MLSVIKLNKILLAWVISSFQGIEMVGSVLPMGSGKGEEEQQQSQQGEEQLDSEQKQEEPKEKEDLEKESEDIEEGEVDESQQQTWGQAISSKVHQIAEKVIVAPFG
jgi:predicted Holliday junction resolvase-like endonuclease